MVEKLKPSEIDKLRALVGTGNQREASEPELSAEMPFEEEPARTNPAEDAPSEPASFETELFVKIDEHAAIGDVLAKSKGSMKSITDTVSLLAKAEKLKSEAIERMESTLNNIDEQIKAVESKIAAPEGLQAPEFGAAAVTDDLIDLKAELDSLKNELGRIQK